MGFRAVQKDSGKTVSLLQASSTTVTKDDAIAFSSGYAQRATSSTSEVRYVALQDQVAGSGAHPELLCLEVEGVKYEADTANNTSQALVGTKIDLTDHDTLNDGASSTDVFFVESIVGAAADKKVLGYFVKKTS